MAAINVSTTAVRLDANTPDGLNPAFITIYNEGPGVIYLGESSTVTSGTGLPLGVGAYTSADVNVAGAAIWGISASGTNVARTLQIRGS